MSSFNPPPGGVSPYAAGGSPPPKKSSALKIILIVVGVLGGASVLCCGAFGLLTWWGFNQAQAVIATEIQKNLESNATVQAELGTIQELKLNFMETGQEGQKSGENNVLVFDAKGDKGSGKLIVRFRNSPGDGVDIVWAKLRKADGSEVDIVTDGPAVELGEEEPATTEAEAAPQ